MTDTTSTVPHRTRMSAYKRVCVHINASAKRLSLPINASAKRLCPPVNASARLQTPWTVPSTALARPHADGQPQGLARSGHERRLQLRVAIVISHCSSGACSLAWQLLMLMHPRSAASRIARAAPGAWRASAAAPGALFMVVSGACSFAWQLATVNVHLALLERRLQLGVQALAPSV